MRLRGPESRDVRMTSRTRVVPRQLAQDLLDTSNIDSDYETSEANDIKAVQSSPTRVEFIF